jgi:hypothetical protein
MAEWLLLWLVAVVLYLVECCSWVRSGAWCCFRSVQGWRASSGSRLFGNDRGGIAFCHPLSQSGAILHCAEWPISISPGAIVHASASQGNQESTPASWSFEEITSVTSSLGDLKINGVSIPAGSDTLAADIAAHVNEPPESRVLPRSFGHQAPLDVVRTSGRPGMTSKQTATLTHGADLVAVVAAPLAIFVSGLIRQDLLLAGLLGLGVERPSGVVMHRKYFKAQGFDRWVHALGSDSFTLSALAVDRISKSFYGRHPVAVICAICPRRNCAREQWFDLDCGLRTRLAKLIRSALSLGSGAAGGPGLMPRANQSTIQPSSGSVQRCRHSPSRRGL